jgi:hypothetical protein
VVWDTGSYWDLGKLRPDILDEIEPKWARIVGEFGAVFREDASYLCMGESEVRAVGGSLRSMAERACWRTHGQRADGTKGGAGEGGAGEGGAGEGCYTVLHGDPKAANFFYNRTQHGGVRSGVGSGVRSGAGSGVSSGVRSGGSGGSGGGVGSMGSMGVGMIDFQWTGVGRPSTDIAYCLAASASGLVLDRDMEPLDGDEGGDGGAGVGELRCLRHYHACLLLALVEYGVVSTVEEGEGMFPYETFRRQFQEAMVDLFRTVVADWWSSMTPALLEEREGAMAFNACNKSMHTALWLIKYTAACMRRLGAVDAATNSAGA